MVTQGLRKRGDWKGCGSHSLYYHFVLWGWSSIQVMICLCMGFMRVGSDEIYWSCAEYWYDLTYLTIRREVVTASLMKILVLCSLFLSNTSKAKKYWYGNCKYIGSVPNILQFSPSRSIQAHLHYLLYEIACSHDVPTECHWVLEQMPVTFHMWAYMKAYMKGIYIPLICIICMSLHLCLYPYENEQCGGCVLCCQKWNYVLPINHCVSGDIQAVQYWSGE